MHLQSHTAADENRRSMFLPWKKPTEEDAKSESPFRSNLFTKSYVLPHWQESRDIDACSSSSRTAPLESPSRQSWTHRQAK